jgi:uncharacterized protein YtpQ (UPF0354 family)
MFNLFKKKTTADPDSSCIVPRIKHTNMLPALSEMKIPPEQLPYTEPLVADLLVAYAFDLPALFQIITKADLQRLDLTPGELRRIALTNLRPQVRDIKTEGQGAPVMMLTVGKDLGACLLLIDEVWMDLANQVPGEVVVAVPTRGVVLITSSEWPEGLALMRELTDGAQEREGTHSLSKHFLVRRQDVWLTFQESA